MDHSPNSRVTTYNRNMLGGALYHLFLPKHLPSTVQSKLGYIDEWILHQVSNTLHEISFDPILPVRKMFDFWKTIQPKSSSPDQPKFTQHFSEKMVQLAVGDCVGVYVRKQNSTLLITKLSGEHTLIETFRPSLPSSSIVSVVGSVAATYPETSNVVYNKNLIASQIFAQHLHELCTDHFEASETSLLGSDFLEHRDLPDPFLVSDWLVGLLVPGSHPESAQSKITKKVRDHITCDQTPKSSPFRRSGMWMSVKVAMYLALRRSVGNDADAKIIYKTILLRILADVCQQYCTNCSNLDIDLISQMLAKLGRRVKKLRKMGCDKKSTNANKIVMIWNSTLQFVYSVVAQVHEQITVSWTNTCFPEVTSDLGTICRSEEEFLTDVLYDIPWLNEYIKKGKSPNVISDIIPTPVPDIVERYPTVDSILAKTITFNPDDSGDLLGHRIWLHETERFLKSELDTLAYPNLILALTSTYVQNALTVYISQKDPVGVSQVFLIYLKAIQILDQIATKRLPLLKEYSTEIVSSQFETLMFPYTSDVSMLDTILAYFADRNRSAVHRSIVAKREITPDTFGVRFAADNQPMMELREKILSSADTRAQEKITEVKKAQEHCLKIQKEIFDRQPCNLCQEQKQCTSCHVLQVMLDKKRHSVSVFNQPLPPDETYQNAVVFELMAPPEIVNLREAMALFKVDLLGHPQNLNKKKWMDHTNLQKYKTVGESLVKTSPVVNLCSDILATANTFRIETPDVLTLNPRHFISANSVDCVYEYKKWFDLPPLAQGAATFQVETTLGTEQLHTNRLQVKNLFKYISSGQLALEKESVTDIIMQMLWRIGSADNNGVRESNFQRGTDTLENLDILDQLLEDNSTNYSNPLILLNVVVITQRILELRTPHVAECYQLLRKCREITASWVTLIDMRISGDNNGQNLLKTRAHVIIASALTYDTDGSKEMFGVVIQSEQDVVNWFQTHFLLSQLSREEDLKDKLSRFCLKLLHRANMVSLKLNFDDKIMSSSESQQMVSRCLHIFASSKWPKIEHCVQPNDSEDSLWNFVEDTCSHVVCRHFIEDMGNNQLQSYLVSFDLILGTFLVNGHRQSELPSTILRHHVYRHYFQSPLKVQGYQRNCFHTVDKFHGHHYEFECSSSEDVTISEIQDDGSKLILLNPSQFWEYVDTTFIDSYTHWVDIDKKIVAFRPHPKTDVDYQLPAAFTMTKAEDEFHWRFCDEQENSWILSNKSKGFLQVFSPFSRFEKDTWVNVLMDKTTGVITVQLPRHQLTFTLIKHQLYSVEYPGFKVSQSPWGSWGTLVGLCQGVLLETDEVNVRRRLLVPHGHLEINVPDSDTHQQVTISLEKVRQPSFFAYEFDPVLKRLKGDKSKAAWLYLAGLHAATSGSLPDPFTGLTGTEMATCILQSAFVWSCAPYDKECLTTLQMIRDMAPKRLYWHDLSSGDTKHVIDQMESIEWPRGLPSMAAFDGYAIIVDKLLDDSYLWEKLDSGYNAPINGGEDRSEKLQMRSYHLHLKSYNSAVSVKPHLLKTNVETLNKTATIAPCSVHSITPKGQESDQIFNLRRLLFLSQTRFLAGLQVEYGSNKNCNLSSFLITPEPLHASCPPPAEMSLKTLFDYELRANWLKLYSMATVAEQNVETKHFFTVLLSALAYRGFSTEQLFNLHNISVLSQKIDFPPVPEHLTKTAFGDLTECYFNEIRISSFLFDHAAPMFSNTWLYNNTRNSMGNCQNRKRRRDEQQLEDKIDRVLKKMKREFWPCENIPGEIVEELSCISTRWGLDEFRYINSLVANWYKNYQLKLFIESVENMLNSYYERLTVPPCRVQFDMLLESVMDLKVAQPEVDDNSCFYEIDKCVVVDDNLDEAALIFHFGKCFQLTTENLITQREECLEKVVGYVEKMENALSGTASTKLLYLTGIAPRLAPTFLARYLLHKLKNKVSANTNLVRLIGAVCVLWVELQRLNRCIAYQSQGQVMELEKEFDNQEYERWSPRENPEWLLLEMDLDVTIPPEEVGTVVQMIANPYGNGARVKIEEEKKSVIVPMMCATLANENDCLCRVTVLDSTFEVNLVDLSFALGGLLNKRVYAFPWISDVIVDYGCLATMEKCYQQCLRMEGVFLTSPEHTLLCDKKMELGEKVREIESWLRKYARDIL